MADFAKDADPTGNIALPMVTLNAANDPTVFVEIADFWKNKVEKSGHGNNLVQTFANDNQHSYISDIHYVSIMNGLLEWITTNKKPTPEGIAKQCKSLDAKWDPKDCRFLPEFKPQPLSVRVPAR